MNGEAPQGAVPSEPTREDVRALSPVFELLTKADVLAHGTLVLNPETSEHMAALSQLAIAQLTHRGVVALESIASTLRRSSESTAALANNVRREVRLHAFRQLYARLGLDTRPDLANDIVHVFEQLALMSGDEQSFTP